MRENQFIFIFYILYILHFYIPYINFYPDSSGDVLFVPRSVCLHSRVTTFRGQDRVRVTVTLRVQVRVRVRVQVTHHPPSHHLRIKCCFSGQSLHLIINENYFQVSNS